MLTVSYYLLSPCRVFASASTWLLSLGTILKLNFLSKILNLFLDFSGITYVVRFRAANLHKDQTISTDSEKIFSCHRAPSSRICRLLTVCIKKGILT